MRVTTFASGSGGNCALVSLGDTHVLLDAGISLRRIRTALARYGLTTEKLSGVLITHEHADHVSGLPMLVKYSDIPIFAPRTVANHLRWSTAGVEKCLYELEPGAPLPLNELCVTAFRTPHDTPESVGYRLEGGGDSFGFCTDLGHVTDEVRDGLNGCASVVLEANHDPEMLRCGPYPIYLKRRILSGSGHLSNESCADFAAELAAAGAGYILLGHLSRENNRPELALAAVRETLDTAGFADVVLNVAPPAEHFSFETNPC
jgi:phosphoribosyl 1,2-cyclic phosphodiesterase